MTFIFIRVININ